jgi:hypothetical protein
MANPLPEEAEFYQKIKDENITISSGAWRLIYQHIGDAISVINLMSNYYILLNEPMPEDVGKTILKFTKKIKETLDSVFYPKQGVLEDDLFKQYKEENTELHPIIREMLRHYIGNDVFKINLIVGDSVYRPDPQPIPIENLHRVINNTHTLKVFMDRLREATCELASF